MRARSSIWFSAAGPFLVAAALACGCEPSASTDTGADALLTIAGAQFFPGPMPQASATGPVVKSVNSLNNSIYPGQRNKNLTGLIGDPATAVAIGFDGDVGFWSVPAGVRDVNDPSALDFMASTSFSPALPIGMRALDFQAIDAQGNAGPVNPLMLTVHTPIPTGELVITLTWDTESDMDLHVVPPVGAEVWARNKNSYLPTPGMMVDPAQAALGGYLDFDSNAACVIDGRRQEDVIWKMDSPSGIYIARVDAYSMCGQSAARWTVVATYLGTTIATATGQAGDIDTTYPHGAGAGVTALSFRLE